MKSTGKEPIVGYVQGAPFIVLCGACEGSAYRLSSFGNGPGALESAIRAARACCKERRCPTCKRPLDRGSFCQPCRIAADRKRLHEDFAKAKKTTPAEYDGKMVTDGDEFYVDPGDCEDDEDHVIELDDGTRFFWGTYPEKPKVDLERACSEDWLQEHHEDAFDWVDLKKLREAQKLVDEALAPVTTYYEDRSVAVVLAPPPTGGTE